MDGNYPEADFTFVLDIFPKSTRKVNGAGINWSQGKNFKEITGLCSDKLFCDNETILFRGRKAFFLCKEFNCYKNQFIDTD